MPDLGMRLQLLIGPTVPTPAPASVVEALVDVEVTHKDRQRDGFKLTFTLGRQGMAQDFGLLQSGLLDPPNRVSIVIVIRALPQVLINGIIMRHQVVPSNTPGQSRIQVFGDDSSVQLDLEERSVIYRNMSDSSIVEKILGQYHDLVPMVMPTSETPSDKDRVVTQQVTDLAFVQELARRNDFVFYTEPTITPGRSNAYWGPKDPPGRLPQPPLTMNMGSETNVEQLTFDFNALEPVTPQANIVEPFTGRTVSIPVPSFLSPLSGQPAAPLRTTILRDTAGMDLIQASLRVLAAASQSADAVTGNGELDAMRYGRALRSRQQVDVRGAGHAHDGAYYVQQVTHRLKRGEYKQSFTLTREGRGATSSFVRQWV
ncbi:MAG: hypothetical protein KC415_05775 [Anaerolineales bacterium]|nr:hypothetical protein [Anaerolineales bacterium]